MIKLGNRARHEGEHARVAVRGFDAHLVIEKAKRHLKRPCAVGNRGSREPTGRYVQRHLPPMIDRRGQSKPNLPYDLRPHVQRDVRVLPPIQQ